MMLQRHRELTKKTASKNNVFWRSYEFLKMAYFWWAQNRAPQINFGDDVTWAVWAKNDCFRGSYLHIEIDLNQKVLTLMKNLLDLFWCKNDRWIQKNRFRSLKIITTSGMTSLIRNLGQFGDVLKFAWDFRETNIVKFRVGVFSLEKTRGIQ